MCVRRPRRSDSEQTTPFQYSMIGYQLAIQAVRVPDAIAVAFGARSYTYANLYQRACRLANGLASLGVGRGDRVGFLAFNCNQFVETMFASALLGTVFVPFNFRLVAREVGLQLDACTPKVLIAGDGFADMLHALKDRASFPQHLRWIDDQPPATPDSGIDHPYEAWLAGHSTTEPDVVTLPGSVQMLLHSSGTTGLPKGIIFTHATTLASSSAKIIDFGLSERDTTVVFGPLFHAGPLMDLAMPLLLRGGKLVLGPSRQFDPMRLLQTIAEERGTVIPIYPTMLRRVVALPDFGGLDLSSLRLIITGGEAAPIPVIRAVCERLPHVDFVNNYGATEAGPITTFLAPKDALRKIGSVGRESFGVQVRIADSDDREVGPDVVGEVLVRGPFVCRGYWNRPEETAASLRNGWWHTGDLAYRDADGFIWIAGRSKDMIKSGTMNIYPIEVEQVIAGINGVIEVSVIGVPDEAWGESVAAYVVRAPGSALDAGQIIDHCRKNLASYKKPRHVVFVDSLPRGTTNKVAKGILRERWQGIDVKA